MFTHDLERSETNEIPGLGNIPYFGHFSPDGKSILFGKKGWIWKTPLDGGKLSLVRRGNNWKTWETNESILIGRGTLGIWRVPIGAEEEMLQVAAIDTSKGAWLYDRPFLLPDGKHVLLSVIMDENWESYQIGVVSTETGELTLLGIPGINPRYAASGHILYSQGNTLKAVPFDPVSLSLMGKPASIVEGVRVYSNRASLFDISDNGTLVYIPGDYEVGRYWPKRLIWVDRRGLVTPFDSQAERDFLYVKLSPDKTRLAAEVGSELHLFDRVAGTWKVLETEGRTTSPYWSADSKTLFYTKDTNFGRYDIETETWSALTDGPETFRAFAVDGDRAIGSRYHDMDVWDLATTSTLEPSEVELLPGSTGYPRRSATLSPDGSLLAYVEKIDGLDKIFVVPYPLDGAQPVHVSAGADGEAAEPLWGADATELFFRDGTSMVSVRLGTEPNLHVTSRANLFETKMHAGYLNTFVTGYDYDASTDRFLVMEWALPNPPGQDIYVVRNAFEHLNRLAPPDAVQGRASQSGK